jgi:hypothetical protein
VTRLFLLLQARPEAAIGEIRRFLERVDPSGPGAT